MIHSFHSKIFLVKSFLSLNKNQIRYVRDINEKVYKTNVVQKLTLLILMLS